MGTPRVNIRSGPSTQNFVVAQAHKGDVFRVLGKTGDWYEIEMFSGEGRYIIAAHFVYPLDEDGLGGRFGMDLPESDELCHTIYSSIQAGLRRAEREAREIIPPSVSEERYNSFVRLREDKILFDMFHNFGLQTLVYGELMDLARDKGW